MSIPTPMGRMARNAIRISWSNGPRLPHAPSLAADGKCGKCGRISIERIHTASRKGAEA